MIAAVITIIIEVIPDLKFLMEADKAVEITLEQLFKTPKDDLPRYIKIKDAVVPASTYVHERNQKYNILMGIYYPVYPKEEAVLDLIDQDPNNKKESNAENTTSLKSDSTENVLIMPDVYNIEARLVIHDRNVQESQLESDSTDNYFNSPTFSIEGKYDGFRLDSETKKLFEEEGIKISKDAIVLNRGDKVMPYYLVFLTLFIALATLILSVASFIHTNALAEWAGIDPKEAEIQLVGQSNTITLPKATTAVNVTPLPDFIKIAPIGKRLLAYVIDYAIIAAVDYINKFEEIIPFQYSIGIAFIYFTACDLAFNGSSIGKLIVRQRVTTLNNNLPLKTVLIRNFIKSASNLFPPIFLLALSKDNKQAPHDLSAKTYVIEKESNVI